MPKRNKRTRTSLRSKKKRLSAAVHDQMVKESLLLDKKRDIRDYVR